MKTCVVVLDGALYSRSNLLFQLRKNLVDIFAVRKFDNDFELLALDVWWVVVFAEEDPDIVLQNIGTLLQDQVDIPQRHVLYFWG